MSAIPGEKVMSHELKRLQAQSATIREKIDKIEAADLREQASKLVGKCFRYRNCYSCPKSDADYWWVYQRVIRSTKQGYLILFSFQVDQYGRFEIEPLARRSPRLHLGEQITLKQFQHAWKVTASMVNHRARSAKAVRP